MRWLSIGETLLILLLALPVLAQEQRGSIEGRVLDLQGAPVANVTVVATGANGSTVRATTNALGIYRFPSLLPSTWNLVASVKDLTLSRAEGVELLLGQLLTVDLTIDTISLSESVQVQSEVPLLDVKQSGRSWHLTAESIEKLPRGRTFASLVTLAPGANWEPRNWGLSIDGSSSTENRHIIDGTETSDPLDGGGFLVYALPGNPNAQMLTLTDFIEELQVKSSGYAAEYGGSTGSVINVVTRTGSNTWHGDAVLYYNADGLDGAPRPSLELDLFDISQASYVTRPKDNYDRWEPGFSVGGPIERDKLWIFGGYHPAFRTDERTVTFLVDGVTQQMSQDIRTDAATVNLTAQLNDRLRLRTAYNLQNQKFEDTLPSHETGSESTTRDFETDGFSSQDDLSAVLDYFPTDRFFMSLRGGWFQSNFHDSGSFEGPQYVFITPNIGQPGVPEELQRPAFFSTENNYSLEHDTRSRLSLLLDGTYFLNAAGEHQLKAGVQWNRVTHDVLSGSNGNLFQIFWNEGFAGQQGAFGHYQVFSNDVSPDRGDIVQGDVQSDNLGLFVQDSWTIKERLTLNIGLRTEREAIPSYVSEPGIPENAIEFGFGDKVAPRLGFAWDVRGDGKWKAYGNWALYYDITKLSIAATYFGAGKANISWFTLDTPDWPNLDLPGCPPECPGELILGPVDLTFLANDPEANLVDPDIEPMRLTEWSLGLEHELSSQLLAGVRYLHKQVDVALEDIGAVDEAGNEIFVIGNPGRGLASLAHVFSDGTTVPYPEATRDYDAVELTLDKRMADRWSGRFSYLWSHLSGNYSGLSDSEFLSAGTPNTNVHFDHPFTQFDETGNPSFGRLATERPHQLKAQFVYDTSFGTSIGMHWSGLSGIPRTRQANFIFLSPVQYLGRESDGRMGFVNQTDLYLQHELRPSERVGVTFSVNVLNLFDQDAATDYYQFELFFGEAVQISGDDFFRGFDTQQLIEEQGLLRDPRFLLDDAFQLPREIRLAVGLRF